MKLTQMQLLLELLLLLLLQLLLLLAAAAPGFTTVFTVVSRDAATEAAASAAAASVLISVCFHFDFIFKTTVNFEMVVTWTHKYFFPTVTFGRLRWFSDWWRGPQKSIKNPR